MVTDFYQEFSIDPVDKDLYNRYGVDFFIEVGVEPKTCSKLVPLIPSSILRTDAEG